MSTRKVSPVAHRESDEEDLTIDSSDDEYDPPPGPDDEYELDGFVVADSDNDDSDDDAEEETPSQLDVDVSNILPAGSRRLRRATRSIYDDPRFASDLAATLLTDVPQDELDVAIGESSGDEESPVSTARKRKREGGECDETEDDDFEPAEDDDFEPGEDRSESDVEIDSDEDDAL